MHRFATGRGVGVLAAIVSAGLLICAANGVLPHVKANAGLPSARVTSGAVDALPSPCRITGTQSVSPLTFRECETAGVTITGRVSCVRPLHAVVAVDQDCNMRAMQAAYRRSAANAVSAFESLGAPAQVGVVLGDAWDQAHVVLRPTSDLRKALGSSQGLRIGYCLGGLPAGEMTFNEGAMIATAHSALSAARRGSETTPVEAIVIVGDSQQFSAQGSHGGPHMGDYQKALSARGAADGDGITVIAACHDCYDPYVCGWGNPEHRNHCMDGQYQKLASSPPFFLYGGDRQSVPERDYNRAYDRVADRARVAALVEFAITDTLAAWIELVPGSMVPPGHVDAAGVLSWTLSITETGAFTVAYRVRPKGLGAGPVSAGARARFTDSLGREGAHTRSSTAITVSVRCITPSPPPSPTPTSTAVPTVPMATATDTAAPLTPTPTSTATELPTRRPEPAILPLALREECVPGRKRIDVALVIDASTSMQEVSGGGTKLDAARAAARALLEEVRLDAGDQAAVIAFSAGATVLSHLTSDRAALLGALERIEVAPQTRIHLGVEAARQVLTGPRHRAEHAAAMVLLTDGRANPYGPAPAVVAAAEAKAAGITVFTIGLGAELDFVALEEMASRPGYFYRTLDAGQLEEIYRAIAATIPCSGERFWGRR